MIPSSKVLTISLGDKTNAENIQGWKQTEVRLQLHLEDCQIMFREHQGRGLSLLGPTLSLSVPVPAPWVWVQLPQLEGLGRESCKTDHGSPWWLGPGWAKKGTCTNRPAQPPSGDHSWWDLQGGLSHGHFLSLNFVQREHILFLGTPTPPLGLVAQYIR